MSIDLSKMSKDELVALQKDVAAAIKDFDKRKKKEALIAAQKAAQEFGFSLEECWAVVKRVRKLRHAIVTQAILTKHGRAVAANPFGLWTR